MVAKANIDDREFRRSLNKIADGFSDRELGKALEYGAEPIVERAKSLAPIDTGDLKDSLKASSWFRDGSDISVRVGTDIVYAAIHEFGGQIAVTPKMRAFLHTIDIHLRGGTKFVTMRPQPYLRPAFNEMLGESKRRVLRKLQKQ